MLESLGTLNRTSIRTGSQPVLRDGGCLPMRPARAGFGSGSIGSIFLRPSTLESLELT